VSYDSFNEGHLYSVRYIGSYPRFLSATTDTIRKFETNTGVPMKL